MQLFKGSYFSVAAGLRPLWPNSGIGRAQCACSKFHLRQSEVYKIIDTFQRSTNETIIIYWYLDIDFNLEICSIIVFLEVWTRADFFKVVPSKLIP